MQTHQKLNTPKQQTMQNTTKQTTLV